MEMILEARTPTIAELIQLCAQGRLAFSGPDSLCAKVAAMGYRTTSLYEMVCAAEISPQPSDPAKRSDKAA